MYVYMYVCMYVHMYVCMEVCTHVCMYVRMYICISIYSTSGSAFLCVFSPCSCCDRLGTIKTTFQMKTVEFDRISGEDKEIATS